MTASVAELTAGMSMEQRAALAGRVRARTARLRTIRQCPTPADLAESLDKTFVRTPAVDLVSEQLARTARTRDGRLVLSVPPQELKALDILTPILTTAGWTTMGEIRPGDEVFHPDGHPSRVVGVSEVMQGRRCYEVTTTDGRRIVADADHLWTVLDRRREKSKGPRGARIRTCEWETITTQEIVDRGLFRDSAARSLTFRLPPQRAIVSKPVDLPLDPYLFGAWLGDGSSRAAQLAVGDEDLDHMVAQVELAGARVVSKRRDRTAWCVRFSIDAAMRDGFESRCRRLGVWGDKHIPDLYLTAGTEQRVALLQGLMDTDGTISTNGRTYRASFTSMRKVLAEGVLYLARSLGWRATMLEQPAMLNGREVGRRWFVAFTPEQGEPVPFRLPRKAAKVQRPQSRAGERHAVSIASVEVVESRPVRCIKVDREDGLFLAGRNLVATHNTTSLRWLCLWLLIDDPDRRIVFASYAAGLARTSGRIIRSLVETFGEEVGLSLDRSHADASDWQIEGHLGGLLSVGVGSSLTGRPSDVMIIDDPLRNQKDAMSGAVLPALHEWWESVARTRLAPGAPVVVVQTRWVEDDLAGRLSGQGWPAVNIPAQADGHTADALNRPAGEYLQSTRGRTPADWAKIRADVGERTWAALYQGRPAPLAGGVFQANWFETWRTTELPAGCLPPTVVIDPADNAGDGDEAGVIVATVQPDSGKVYILDDLSAPMTVARWARLALLTCVRRHAPALAFEKSLSQLPTRIREAWAQLHLQATAVKRAKGDREAALKRLLRADDGMDAQDQTDAALAELTDADVDGILAVGKSGPRLRAITAKGTKSWRMQLAAPAFETGRAVLVGRHPQLEHQAITWQVGQDSPDRVDALVHAVQLLSGQATVTSLGTTEERIPTRSTGRGRTGGAPGGARIGRSTGRRR